MSPLSCTSLPPLPIPPIICRDVDGPSPFSRGSSWPRDRTKFVELQADPLMSELPGTPMDGTRDYHTEWSTPQFLTYYFKYISKRSYLSVKLFCSCVTFFKLLLFNHSVVSDSANPGTAARQASLSFTISQSLLKLMSTESLMPSNHFILCCPLLLLLSIFPAWGSFWGKAKQKSHSQDLSKYLKCSIFSHFWH